MEKFSTFLENKLVTGMEHYLHDEGENNQQLFELFSLKFEQELSKMDEGMFDRWFKKKPQEQPVNMWRHDDYDTVPLSRPEEIVPLKQVGLNSKVVSDFIAKLQSHPQIKKYFVGNKMGILNNLVNAWNQFKREVKNMQNPNSTNNPNNPYHDPNVAAQVDREKDDFSRGFTRDLNAATFKPTAA